MTSNIFAKKSDERTGLSVEECDEIQDRQNADFQRTWQRLDPEIALVCVCGNHDVGNRPNKATVQRFRNAFGDDYLAFWAKTTYNIVLNTNLFADPSDARDMYDDQLTWLEQSLQDAQQHGASHIFVFGHHPWFLYRDDETSEELSATGSIFDGRMISDSYFHIPLERRTVALNLFEKYGVSACFAGHFHQNMVAMSSWGMPMIITTALSMVVESSGIPESFDELRNKRGVRIVQVRDEKGVFHHSFIPLPE